MLTMATIIITTRVKSLRVDKEHSDLKTYPVEEKKPNPSLEFLDGRLKPTQPTRMIGYITNRLLFKLLITWEDDKFTTPTSLMRTRISHQTKKK